MNHKFVLIDPLIGEIIKWKNGFWSLFNENYQDTVLIIIRKFFSSSDWYWVDEYFLFLFCAYVIGV